MDDRTIELRRALVDAIAAAHRLRQEAIAEEREAERWVQRATFAEERALDDLAVGARARAGRHSRMARLLDQRAGEMRAEVQRLRSELESSAGAGRPPPASDIEVRFAALEVERELEQLRAARTGDATGPPGEARPSDAPPPVESQQTDVERTV